MEYQGFTVVGFGNKALVFTGKSGKSAVITGVEAQQIINELGITPSWLSNINNQFGRGYGGTAPHQMSFSTLQQIDAEETKRQETIKTEEEMINKMNQASTDLKNASGGIYGVNSEQINSYLNSGMSATDYIKTLTTPTPTDFQTAFKRAITSGMTPEQALQSINSDGTTRVYSTNTGAYGAQAGSPPNATVQPITDIPFKTGLNDTQIQSIQTLLTNKPIERWNNIDKANWNYATNNSPLPSTPTTLQTIGSNKTFYRQGINLINASTGQRITGTDWEANWTGRATEVSAPTNNQQSSNTQTTPTTTSQAPSGAIAINGAQYNTKELQEANFTNITISADGKTLYGIPKINQQSFNTQTTPTTTPTQPQTQSTTTTSRYLGPTEFTNLQEQGITKNDLERIGQDIYLKSTSKYY